MSRAPSPYRWPLTTMRSNGAPGGISQAIEVGHALLADGVKGVVDERGSQVLLERSVDHVDVVRRQGFDIGRVRVADTEITFVNEYRTLEIAGERAATFPDLAMTVDAYTGRPLVSAELKPRQRVAVLAVPKDQLQLSTTMCMPELTEAVNRLLESIAA